MSGGQPVPPRIVEAFAINAGGAYITNPFPVASQISVTPGRASLNDGFVPLNMTDPTAGGIPPFGEDMNGILYLISAWVAFFAAGQVPTYDATLAADMSGYALGAVVQQSADTTAFWINTIAGNASDPDTGTPGDAGWVSTKPLHVSVSAGGNNVALPGPSDYVYDVDASGGAINFTGFVMQRDGQRLVVRKIDSSANNVTFASLSGSSLAANQLEIVTAGLALGLQYETLTLMYNSTVGKWVQA